MRRTLLIPFAAVAVLVAMLLPAAAFASEPTAPVVAADPASLRLGCSITRYHAAPAVLCKWSAAESDNLRGYRLWRTVGAPGSHARVLIGRIGADQRLRHLDTRVRRGHVYTYAVVAVGKDGSKVAVGGPVAVRIPGRHHGLRIACAFRADGDLPGVGCRWSASKAPRAVGYILWRSVDGAAREAIYLTALDGQRHFFDTDIEPGQTVRYVVVAVNGAGHRVGKGGPVFVHVPK
jgi:hypothetical protein